MILSTKVKKITSRKTGLVYEQTTATVECPGCGLIYEKGHYIDRPLECKSCIIKIRNSKKIGIHYTDLEDLSGTYFNILKRGALKRKLEFTVTKQYLWDLYLGQNSLCKLSGLPIKLKSDYKHWETSKGRGTRLDRSTMTASLDRIDSSKGYVEGNLQWIHKVINIMKGNLSDNDFVYFCKSVSKNNIQDNTEPRLLNGGNYFRSKVQRLTGEPPSNNPDTRTQQP